VVQSKGKKDPPGCRKTGKQGNTKKERERTGRVNIFSSAARDTIIKKKTAVRAPSTSKRTSITPHTKTGQGTFGSRRGDGARQTTSRSGRKKLVPDRQMAMKKWEIIGKRKAIIERIVSTRGKADR